MNIVEIPSV